MLRMLSSTTGDASHRSDSSPNPTSLSSPPTRPLAERQPSLSHIHLPRRPSTLDIHPSAVSPFDRLPVELHAEIFSHCLGDFPHLDDPSEAPMTIARVCGAWRALVYATPKLWASFEIEVQDCQDDAAYWPLDSHPATSSSPPPSAIYADPRQVQYVVKLLNSVQIWLERSRNHLLSVRVIHMPSTLVPGRLSSQLLAMLVAHARRWRNVEFVLPSTSLGAVQGLFPEDFPALKRLKIHMKGQWNVAAGLGGGAAPGAMMQLPWSQLTSVDLRLDHAHLLNLDEYLELLSDAATLVDCRFNAICSLSVEASQVWRGTGAAEKGSENGTIDYESNRTRVLRLAALERLHLVLQAGSTSLHGLGLPGAGGQQLVPAQQTFLRPGESLVAFLSLFTSCKLTHLQLNWLIDPPNTPQQQNNTDGINRTWDSSVHSKLQTFLRGMRHSLHSLQLSYLPLGEVQLLQCLAQLCFTSSSSTTEKIQGVRVNDDLEGAVAVESGERAYSAAMPSGRTRSASPLESLDLRFSIADHEQDPITDRFFGRLTVDSLVPQPGTPAAAAVPLSAENGHSGGGATSKISTHFELLRRNAQTALGVGQPSVAVAAGGSTAQPENPSATSGRKLHFPRLERIRLYCSGERCGSKALVQMVQSRLRQPKSDARGLVSSLKEFQIHTMTPILPDVARYTEAWRKAGVDAMVESVVLM